MRAAWMGSKPSCWPCASSIPNLSRVMRIRPDALLGVIRPISTFHLLGARDRYMTRLHSHKPFNPA